MTLSRHDINVLKGLAIILIVLHNVTHVLVYITGNEFNFLHLNLEHFVNNLSSQPVTAFFAFYGWVGVAVFIFASAYGLSVKYKAGVTNTRQWILRHFLKLLILLLPAWATFVLIEALSHPVSLHEWLYFGLEPTLLLNIISPDSFNPGVFWYIGMAMQLYLWFIVLQKLSDRNLVLIVFICIIILAVAPEETVSYLRHNSIGWLPEFVFGMLFFRHSNTMGKHAFTKFIIAVLLVGFFSASRYTFMLVGPCFVYALLQISRVLSRSSILAFIGRISPAIYVVHPVVRSLWLRLINKFDLVASPMTNAVTILTISLLVSFFYFRIYTRLLKIIN